MCNLCDPETRQKEINKIDYIMQQMTDVIEQLHDIKNGRLLPHKNIRQWELLSIQSKNVIKELVEYL